MPHYRCLVVLFFCFSCVLVFSWTDDRNIDESSWLDHRARSAIRLGLRYLVNQQNLSPRNENRGSFGKDRDRKYSIAATSFAGLALMADGNLPGRGLYGKNVNEALEFILRHVNQTGYIARARDNSRMHGHGFATLFLAEAYGTTDNLRQAAKIRRKLKKAIACSLRSQTVDGGWGYRPTDRLHEGSVTVVQLQALRAARNAGIHVPKRSIDRAIEYIRRSANPNGSFKYRLGGPARSSFPLAAAGVASLNATGEYESREIRKGLKFMMEYLPPHGKRDQYYKTFYYYGHFYGAQAMYHAPESYWRKWFPAVRDDLINKQDSRTGAWKSRHGNAYATAIATLILHIPYRYLPIFQR